MHYILSKEKFAQQLKLWNNKFQIFVPTAENSDFVWQKTENFDLKLINNLTKLPPTKKFFVPKSEIFFNFSPSKLSIPKHDKPVILLGVNLVDLRAIELLDKVMNGDFYYQQNREKFILIGIGQLVPPEKFDLFIKGNGNNFELFVGTRKGQSILNKKLLKKIEVDPKLNPTIVDPLFADQKKLSSAVKASINDEIWDKLAKICFGCGVCSYVCPLCYCFTIEDKLTLTDSPDKTSCQTCGTRVRNWDACFLAHFSEVSGGYNFRPKLRDRIYNWYHHKFVRFPLEFGRVGCVSCGRCIKSCPAKINYRKVLEEVLEKYS